MTPDPAPRPRSERLGVPGIDALMDAHDAEQEVLNGLMVVTSAESTILNAGTADLVVAEKRARRRKAAARAS